MPRFRCPSVRQQLLLWFLVPILGLIVLSIFSSYYLARRYANSAFDDGLEETAKAVAGQVEFQNGQWQLASPELSKAVSAHEVNEKLYFLITLPNGSIIGGNPKLGKPKPYAHSPYFRTIQVDRESFRIVTLQVPLPRHTQDTFLWVQVGETLIGRQKLVQEILIHTIGHQLVLFLLVALCIYGGLYKGLLPLERLSKEVARRSPKDLHHLDESQVPREVLPLVENLNRLMAQLESHLGAQHRFVANAAHQLRTPLAGLKTQLELLKRQTDPIRLQHAITQMEISLERSIQLSQQLLALAKVDSGVFNTAVLHPVHFNQVAETIIETYVPLALQKDIELGFEAPDYPCVILGDELILQELLSNLLDNAFRYTPSHGQVRVQMVQAADRLTLIIEDTGPGIPEKERQKVFERFYRGNHVQSQGSGLGLSIVQEIVLAHQAEIKIEASRNQTGTKVSVIFKEASIL